MNEQRVVVSPMHQQWIHIHQQTKNLGGSVEPRLIPIHMHISWTCIDTQTNVHCLTLLWPKSVSEICNARYCTL
jgi:hypothetical protein